MVPQAVPTFQAVIIALAAHFGQPLDQPTVYVRLSMPHFDDLVIERIGPQQFSVAHYQTIDSDRIANPEVVIFVTTAGAWVPIIYQTPSMIILGHDLGGYQELAQLNDRGTEITRFTPARQADVADFCRTWAKNLIDQQWQARAAVTDQGGA